MRKITLFLVMGLFLVMACDNSKKKSGLTNEEDKALHERSQSLFQSISSLNLESPDADKVELGRYLYFDEALSLDRNISCNSCHALDNFGVDNLQFSPGDDGSLGGRNSPTVFHAALHKMQFWDGRAADVEEQAGGPILNPVEHNIKDEAQLVNRLKSEGFYDELFAKAFKNSKDPITFKNLTHAIGAFERTLVPESRFDQYLDGDLSALSDQEKMGLNTFIETGCITCHSGPVLGGQMLQKFGLFGDYWKETQSESIDLGLYEISGEEGEKHFFKVPGLRNIIHTGPYFHDGSIDDLGEAVQIMSRLQTNKELTKEELSNVLAFFEALTADIPEEAKANPFDK